MSEQKQIEAFAQEIQLVIKRYRTEFTLSLAAAIGTLEVIKLELFNEQSKQ